MFQVTITIKVIVSLLSFSIKNVL